jgi:hypothetical protein
VLEREIDRWIAAEKQPAAPAPPKAAPVPSLN